MPHYLVTIHRPAGYDPLAEEDEAMHQAIDVLNEEMVAAGIRIYVGGLHGPEKARAVRRQAGGSMLVTDGPYTESKEHIGGLWVLEAASTDEALGWARKAAAACRAGVEVRQFH